MNKSEHENSPLDKKLVESLLARSLYLEAKCDALIVCMFEMAVRQGISPEKARAVIDKQIALAHQRLLEKVEKVDPQIAATLDDRPPLDDIFD
jgi:predicted RNase H-like HicB family nuclease